MREASAVGEHRSPLSAGGLTGSTGMRLAAPLNTKTLWREDMHHSYTCARAALPAAILALLLASSAQAQGTTAADSGMAASAPTSTQTPPAQKKPAKRGAQSGHAASGVTDGGPSTDGGAAMPGAEKKPAQRGAQSGPAPSAPAK
jgi:hypothetical protein